MAAALGKHAIQDAGTGTLRSSMIGILAVPSFPSEEDWALRLRFISE